MLTSNFSKITYTSQLFSISSAMGGNIFYSAAINEHAAAAAVRKQSMLFTKWEPCEKKVKYRKPVKKELGIGQNGSNADVVESKDVGEYSLSSLKQRL